MKKLFTILALAVVLASCKQKVETPAQTPTNTGNTQVEAQKVAENTEIQNKNMTNSEKSDTQNIFENDDFSLKLPEGFVVEKFEDSLKIVKTSDREKMYFTLWKISKEDSEKIKKCEKQKEANGQKLCDLSTARIDILTLNYLENSKNGQLLMINSFLDKDQYKDFGVNPFKEINSEEELEAENKRVQKEILEYFKKNLTFKK